MSNTQTFFSQSLAERDAPVRGAILKELERQQSQVELIASENIVSKAVLEAAGSIFTPQAMSATRMAVSNYV